MASIDGATVVLLREPRSEERRMEFLEIIQKECRRLNRLLTTLLNFATPPEPEYQMIAVEQLVDSVIALAGHAICRDRILLRKKVAGNLPSLECDPEQLTQVLLNLTINAIQAMPEGGEILLSADRHERSIIIEVREIRNPASTNRTWSESSTRSLRRRNPALVLGCRLHTR